MAQGWEARHQVGSVSGKVSFFYTVTSCGVCVTPKGERAPLGLIYKALVVTWAFETR